MIDNYGRNINYIRISLTNMCNLRCIYCVPGDWFRYKKKYLKFKDVVNLIKAADELGIKKIRYTGGEPLLFRNIEKLIYETSKLKRINDISITTNGILLKDKIKELKKYGLNRVNISLDTLNSDKFKYITRGGDISKVFNGISKCMDIGMDFVKINVVVIRGINDDEIDSFINIARDFQVYVRFIELMPIGAGLQFYKNGFVSSREIIENHPYLKFLKMEYGSTAVTYTGKNFKGYIQFISAVDNKFCKTCNRIRIMSGLTIKPCLHSDLEIDIKKYINNREMLKYFIYKSVLKKPREHNLDNNKSHCNKMMYQIGG